MSTSLSDFVENFAHFADADTNLVASPCVLSPSTVGGFRSRASSLKSDLDSHHTNRSSISKPGSVESKRLSLLMADCRSVQNSPRILPNQTLPPPPNTALPPIPDFASLRTSRSADSGFPISPGPEPHKEISLSDAAERDNAKEEPAALTSLSTLQAIRALAQPGPSLHSGGEEEQTELEQQSCEIKALRAALSYTLSRSDRLRESLAREQAEKRAVISELAVLRANVLSILGKSVFNPSREMSYDTSATMHNGAAESPTQDDAKDVLTSVSRSKLYTASAVSQRRMKSEDEKSLPTPPIGSPLTGGVSISSLRKSVQPTVQGLGIVTSDRATTLPDEESDDDESAEQPSLRQHADVSLSEFLNASRMSKIEIKQRDARLLSPDMQHKTERWRNSSRSSPSLGLAEHFDTSTPAATVSSSPGIGKFLRGISKKMESERQRIMQPSSSRRASPFILGDTTSNSRLVGNASFASLGRNSSVYSSLAPSTATFHSASTASASRRDWGRSSINSAFSEGPSSSTRPVSRLPMFVENSIIPVQHIGRQATSTGLVSS